MPPTTIDDFFRSELSSIDAVKEAEPKTIGTSSTPAKVKVAYARVLEIKKESMSRIKEKMKSLRDYCASRPARVSCSTHSLREKTLSFVRSYNSFSLFSNKNHHEEVKTIDMLLKLPNTFLNDSQLACCLFVLAVHVFRKPNFNPEGSFNRLSYPLLRHYPRDEMMTRDQAQTFITVAQDFSCTPLIWDLWKIIISYLGKQWLI